MNLEHYPPDSPEAIALFTEAAKQNGQPEEWGAAPGLHNILRRESAGWVGSPNFTYGRAGAGWQLLALRAAKDTGLPVPDKNIRQAVHFIKRCAHPSGGFSYQPGGDPNTGRTGTGILSLEICGEHGSPEARRGGDWLLKHPLKWKGPFFYYGAYYAAQGMYQLGGNYWKQWQPVSEKLLLEKQSQDGSWPPPRKCTDQ